MVWRSRSGLLTARHRLVAIVGLLAIALLAIACQPPPPTHLATGEVQRTVSGQTLDVTVLSEASNQIERVRLLGIAAPDLQQIPWGPAARDALSAQLPPRARIDLEFASDERDAYQRRLAYVWQDGRLINEDLVARGWVLAATDAPDQRYRQRLERAQDYARIMGLGIWQPDQPLRQTPREFRAGRP